MNPRIVDSSIAVKWLLSEIHAEAARRLLGGGYSLLVPDLLFAEVANVLWKRVRRGEMSEKEASATLQSLETLPLQVFATWPLALLALEIACQTGRTAYDSLYLALAVQEKGVMVTADRKLYEAIRGGPLSSYICWVEDVV